MTIEATQLAKVRKNKYTDTMLPYYSGATVVYIMVIVDAIHPSDTINSNALKNIDQ